MNKEVSLIEYLPPFIREFKEIKEITDAENLEFQLAWEEMYKLRNNMFIVSADVNGIKRFEKILKIYPSEGDSLEISRDRVLLKWMDSIPYTITTLRRQLDMLCGEGNFKVNCNSYLLMVELNYEIYRWQEEINKLLLRVIPMNILIDITFLLPIINIKNINLIAFPSLSISFSIFNGKKRPIFLNGERKLDGSWLLNQHIEGALFNNFGVQTKFTNRERLGTSHTYHIGSLKNNLLNCIDSIKLETNLKNKHKFKTESVQFVLQSIKQKNSINGSVTIDSMWKLDGSVLLDGSRKLNASIIREVI